MLSVTRSNLARSSLEEIEKQSEALLNKKMAARFLDKTKDSQEVVNLVEQLRTAIVCYQVSGNHLALARVNTRGTALATTVDIQPDRETDGKFSHRSCPRPQY